MAYTPTPEQMQREYVPGPWHPRYTPRPDPIVTMERATKAQPMRRPWFDDEPKARAEPRKTAARKPPRSSAPTAADLIIDLLRSELREWLSSEICERTGVHHKSLGHAVRSLEDAGLAVSRPRPGYRNWMLYRAAGAPETHDETGSRRHQVIEVLRSEPGRAWLASEIAERVGCATHTISCDLRDAVSAGLVVSRPHPARARWNVYRATEGAL